MASIEKYGLVMKGLKSAAGDTHNEKPYSNWHSMVFYDMDADEVWTEFIYGRNNWCVYENKNIVMIADTTQHLTMQEIADKIKAALDYRKEHA